MFKIEPIPEELLIHQVVYLEAGESDGWNTPVGDPQPITNVRIQPLETAKRTANSEGVVSQFQMLIDRVHSKPFLELKVGSTVLYKEKEYKVSEVNPQYDFDTVPHHYEIGMN